MLFRLEDVHKSYGAHEVLCGATFQVNPGERVGLVGRNGAGKTTIFRLIAGLEEPDRGRVVTLRGLAIGVLDQQPTFGPTATVREEALAVFTHLRSIEKELGILEHRMAEVTGGNLEEVMHRYSELRHQYEMEGGFTYHARAEAVLAGLGFRRDDLLQPTSQLSGGQKARLALAKLLLSQPDVLLLDEPTNHLDISAVEWLEDFLADYRRAFVIISHDRFLLDRTTTKVVEVAHGLTNVYQGNYTAYTKQREERRLAQARQYEQQQELIARTEEFIRRNIAGQKTKQAKSRRNMLERLDRVEALREDRTADFGMKGIERVGDTVLAVSDLLAGYDAAVVGNISFLMRRGDRLGVIGPNGSGKTTFLRTILGEIEALGGGYTWGANVHIGYLDQELSSFNPNSSVIAELAIVAPQASEGELRNYLAKLLFTGDDIYKPVSALSGGERSRLALARLVHSRASVLVLDEPTNHLDIRAREALELALTEYPGTIIAVSHDRYFLDRIATEILHFENGQATYHIGSYSDFYAERHRAVTSTDEPVPSRRSNSRSRTTPRFVRSEKLRRRKPEEIEQEIQLIESELGQLAGELSTPALDWRPERYAEISERQHSLSSKLEQLYEEWESAAGSNQS